MSVAAIIIAAPVLIMSVVIHEVSHGYIAYRLGDMTAYLKGRLSLNPIKHIDLFMTILLPVILLISTNFRFFFGGAKPVPINPLAFRGTSMRKGMMLTAAAGPVSNILIAVGLAVCLALALTVRFIAQGAVTNTYQQSLAWEALSFCIIMNLVLAFFNLIPVPPLDGSRVLSYFLPRELSQKMDVLERQFGIMLIFILLMVSRMGGFNIIGWFLKPVWYVAGLLLAAALLVAEAAANSLLALV